MTTEKYGSPKLKDSTAKLEGWIDEAAQKVTTRILNEGPKSVSRPPGTQERPLDQQVSQYMLMMNDPMMIQAHLAGMEQQMGKNAARIELVSWAKKMQAQMEKQIDIT